MVEGAGTVDLIRRQHRAVMLSRPRLTHSEELGEGRLPRPKAGPNGLVENRSQLTAPHWAGGGWKKWRGETAICHWGGKP